MKSWVDISVPGRQAERYRIADGGTTLGGSSSADIQILNVPGILNVHCYLRPQIEGCWIELIETALEPFSHEGKPARSALVPWGHDVFLGSVRLTVAADTSGDKRGASPMLIGMAVVLPLLAASFFLKPSADAKVRRSAAAEPPALFGPMPSCSEQEEGALGRASVAEQLARAKHERGVFEVIDLVDSVQLVREAATCYALGGNQGASDRALDLAEAWIADLQFTYKRAQLDFEIARRAERSSAMLAAIAQLKLLLTHAGPEARPFKEAIEQQRRQQLAVMADKKKKKKH